MGAILALTATDAELAQRCLQGDQQAWAEIVRQYSRRIYNLAYRFTTSHSAAEDLTQEVFIRVYRSLSQYDASRGDLSNWLMRLARNLIIDDYRKRQRTPTLSKKFNSRFFCAMCKFYTYLPIKLSLQI